MLSFLLGIVSLVAPRFFREILGHGTICQKFRSGSLVNIRKNLPSGCIHVHHSAQINQERLRSEGRCC